jgi:hypothetical protein
MRKHYHIVWKDHDTGEKYVDPAAWHSIEDARTAAKQLRDADAKETWVVRKCRLKCEPVDQKDKS